MRAIASIGLSLAFALAVGLPGQDEETPPAVTLKLASSTAKPGAKLSGKVVISFAPGLHGYQNPPTLDYNIPVKLESATKGVTLKPTYPKGVMKEFAGETTAVYEGAVTVPVQFTLPKSPGKYVLKVKVSYQQCTDVGCFPPGSKVVSAAVTVKR